MSESTDLQSREQPITHAELEGTETEIAQLQARNVATLEGLLNRLTGRRAANPQEGKRVADKIGILARAVGAQVMCKDTATSVRWFSGVFEARKTDPTRKVVDSGVQFPELHAKAKMAIVTPDSAEQKPRGIPAR